MISLKVLDRREAEGLNTESPKRFVIHDQGSDQDSDLRKVDLEPKTVPGIFIFEQSLGWCM